MTRDRHAETRPPHGALETEAGTLRYLNLRGDLTRAAHTLCAHEPDTLTLGALPFYARLTSLAIGRTRAKIFQQTISRATNRLVTQRMAKKLPPAILDAAPIIASRCGLSTREVLAAHLVPETMRVLEDTWGKARASYPLRAIIGPTRCASALRKNSEGDLLIARNLDFPGASRWDEMASVTFYHPDQGLSYVAISSAGFLGPGPLAMNSAGLVICASPRGGASIDLDATPFGVAAEEAIRRASDIDAAIAILRQHPHVASWRYTLAEGDTGRAATFEISSQHQRRVDIARESLAASTPHEMAHWLLGKQDEDTVLMRRHRASVNTIASVIFEPAHRRVWVASGPSPTPLGQFTPFILRARYDGGVDPARDPFCIDPDWAHSAHAKGMSEYRAACIRHVNGDLVEPILASAELALAILPEDQDLHVLVGLLAIKAGRARRAQGVLGRALKGAKARSPRRAEIALYLGWALDLLPQRLAAKDIYKRLSSAGDTPSHIAWEAKKRRLKALAAEDARALDIDPFLASAAALARYHSTPHQHDATRSHDT